MQLTGLPAALAPWAAGLRLFPREIALALAPMLPRLSAVLGPGAAPAAEGHEPDGYDGVARKGSYERLLTGEWLLLSEMPDEFLRRVAAGEHAFFHVARRAAEAARHTVVLFDTGPEQLGAPRLAHIAALVVLAARAGRQRGTLSWGALQDETRALDPAFTRASIQALLERASPRPASERDVRVWLDLPAVSGASERWLVSSEDIRPVEARRSASMLRVTEALEIGARKLHVTALPGGAQRPRQAVLELPDPKVCVRMLRDPFGTAVTPRRPAPAGVDPSAGLVVASDGHTLYLRGTNGELLSQKIPGSPRAPLPSYSVFRPPEGQYAVAAGVDRDKRRTVVVCAGERAYHVYALSRHGKQIVTAAEHPFEPGSAEAPDRGAPLRALYFINGGGLWFGDLKAGPVVLLESRPAFIERDESKVSLHRNDRVQQWGLRAFKAPQGATCVGVVGVPVREPRSHAVILSRSRMCVELAREELHFSELLFSTATPVEAISVATDLPMVGYLTEAGEVGVYAVRERAMVLRLVITERSTLRRPS